MHIEPGYIAQSKIVLANVAALSTLAWYAKDLIKVPSNIVPSLLAALFFTLFMQSFHMSVGPSELHFVGAMAMYLTLGFIPTLIGFAAGLLFQGILFDPIDLPHLAVNSLSLMLPLIASHAVMGKKLLTAKLSVNWRQIIKLDAIYYAGVTSMVGFWLMIGEVETPFTAWLAFASSYAAIIAIEPVVSMAAVTLLKRYDNSWVVSHLFSVNKLQLAQ